MWKSGVTALLAATVISPCFAQSADEFEQGMGTMWEVLWHQSGTPTRIVRWENDLSVRFTGANVQAHRAHMMEALSTVAGESHLNIRDVTGTSEERTANVTVEILAAVPPGAVVIDTAPLTLDDIIAHLADAHRRGIEQRIDQVIRQAATPALGEVAQAGAALLEAIGQGLTEEHRAFIHEQVKSGQPATFFATQDCKDAAAIYVSAWMAHVGKA